MFAEHGYHGASIEEIARRAGVSPPVIHDHFASKLELHKRLLERTRDELVPMWSAELGGDSPAEERIRRGLDAWARYVQEHPYAPRMFFVETTGRPEVQAVHREIQAGARRRLGAILGREQGAEEIAGSGEPLALEMAAEVIRAGLTGLAIWWLEHPEVTREQIVTTAMNVVWIGFERVQRGEGWAATPSTAVPRPAAEALAPICSCERAQPCTRLSDEWPCDNGLATGSSNQGRRVSRPCLDPESPNTDDATTQG